jgi:hypothetical protein
LFIFGEFKKKENKEWFLTEYYLKNNFPQMPKIWGKKLLASLSKLTKSHTHKKKLIYVLQ